MIYLDASVALAQLFAEDRQPPEDLWREPIAASRLLQYEVWNRVHARRLEPIHGHLVRELLDGVAYVELTPLVLARALEPFPVPVRTLDALHLATIEFLRGQGQTIELVSYDGRLLAAARALGIPTRGL
ncbi:MAG TPA: PIN domain-containing protein [Candidatus Tectomicrobia bacterium]|nr:PIN domain-containing protein [Candidatus Tectomicrobia bacterium]